MKKVLSLIPALICALCYGGAWAVHHYTGAKMGMSRYVVGQNRKWEKAYNVELLTTVLMLVVAAAVIALLIVCIKRRKGGFVSIALCSTAAISAVIYLGYTLFYDTKLMRDYYFISALLAIAALFSCVCLCVTLCVGRK